MGFGAEWMTIRLSVLRFLMTTLVTGATGFVGSHVARQLLAAGHSVRALVRPTSNLKSLDGLPVERAEGDLRDVISLDRAMKGVRWVFHVAADYRLWAQRSDGDLSRAMWKARAGFLRSPRKTAWSALCTPAPWPPWRCRVTAQSLPNEETHATLDQMIGHYKRSKFLAELEAIKAAAQGIPVVIVNPTAPVGPGDWKPTPTGKIIVDFLNGKMPAYVDTGLNLVAVEDVAAGHLLAAQKGRIGERYILGARNMTLREILEALAKITGRSAPRVRLPHAVALAAAYADELLRAPCRPRAADSCRRRENVAPPDVCRQR